MPPSSMPLAADGAPAIHSVPPGEACTLLSSRPEGLTREEAEALRRILPRRVRVRRDGGEAQIPAEGLVPGDILLLSEGDHVSADARVIAETELRIDQSTLTGESHPVRKTRGRSTGWPTCSATPTSTR
jgi:P-type Ca2+ transporter type 2C